MDNFNAKKLREIDRLVVAIILLSSDNKILLGKKDPKKGGVYTDAWHTPGGGVNEGEGLMVAAKRECLEETGIDLANVSLKSLPYVGHGSSEKILKTGEAVWCNMVFHRFEARLNLPASIIKVVAGDDLVELKWYPLENLSKLKLIPGAKEFFAEAGYI